MTKQYKNALLALESSGTPSAKQNKFVKISIEATDDVLKQLCKDVATMYSYYIKPRWSRDTTGWTDEKRATIPVNFRQWNAMQNELDSKLKEYVNFRLSQSKPEWMVMAEKHGWRPPM